MPKELLISQGPLADLSSQEIAALAYAARKAVALADAAQEGEAAVRQAHPRASQIKSKPAQNKTAMAKPDSHGMASLSP
jgi:hypothetical protein